MIPTCREDWAGNPVFLIGGGPSAGRLDLGRLRGRGIVVAINDSVVKLPWADVAFTADLVWLVRRQAVVSEFKGLKVLATPRFSPPPPRQRRRGPRPDIRRARRQPGIPPIPGLRIVERRTVVGLSDEPGVCHAGNSGHGALTWVVAQGAADIALIGYDMAGPGHWHGGYEWTCRFGAGDFPEWVAEMNGLAPQLAVRGIRVVNLNRDSAIRCFPFADLGDVLDRPGLSQHRGIWLPSSDTHMRQMLDRGKVVDGRPTYQFGKLEAACRHVKQFRAAVDVGAHAGLWAMHLARRFAEVDAFEPVALFRECFRRNVNGSVNGSAIVRLHDCALGDKDGSVVMTPWRPGNSGETMVAVAGEDGEPAARRTLDAHMTGPVDLIKIDCEGYEYFVLQGGRRTIARDRPVIVVEQHDPHAARYGLAPKAGRDWLIGEMGYRVAEQMTDDCIMVPV
jgi:FkbM family methyltransferase